MFARIVEITVKPEKLDQFRSTLTRDIVPALRKQPGFVDAVSLVGDQDPYTAVSVSFWHTKAEAERYNSEQFPKLIAIVKAFLNNYTVRTFQVENSTFHKIAAGKAA